MSRLNKLVVAASACMLLLSGGCGGKSSQSATSQGSKSLSIGVSPQSITLRGGDSQQFTAIADGSGDPSVIWLVNYIPGGDAVVGQISPSGLYTAPSASPTSDVTVTAISRANYALSGSGKISVLNPFPAITSVSPSTFRVGNVSLRVSGRGFVPNTVLIFNGRAISVLYGSPNELSAVVPVASSDVGNLSVEVRNPSPGAAESNRLTVNVESNAPVSYDAAVRFLEQSTFGPTEALISHVQQVGFSAFLDEQFAVAPSSFRPPPELLDQLQIEFIKTAVNGQDQLRQRVAFALGQIFVVSGAKVGQPSAIANWLQLLNENAFGKFPVLVRQVTLNPAMGNYLDMVNNDAPQSGRHANENYARELLQLFSIGVYELNRNGTPRLDSSGKPINSYDQQTIKDLARVFTGWTYAAKLGTTSQLHNPENYDSPMTLVESNHDDGVKKIFNAITIPGGQGGAKDLDDAIAAVSNHPNVGPFICKQLIQHLVKSNPGPDYIERVAGVFEDNGSGVRGDLQAVVRAVLLDNEARVGDVIGVGADEGHLREPLLFITALLRALSVGDPQFTLVEQSRGMGQNILFPPSVFNYFHIDYKLPTTDLLSPEFEIATTATQVQRANFVNSLVIESSLGTPVDLTPWITSAASPDLLLDKLNHFFLHGRMSSDMRDTILTAIAVCSDDVCRTKQGLYLTTTSPEYMVQQ